MPKVFISAGTAATDRQKQATESVFAALRNAGLSPRQMNTNEWSFDQPLRAIRGIIEECDGVAVVAFSRYAFPAGTERKNEGDQSLTDVRFPTVWNQIEAAFGYARGLPLLVIAERGLKEDGLLEGKYDWSVFWTDLDPKDFQSERFAGWINSWKRAVVEHEANVTRASSETLDPSKLTIGSLVKNLTVSQLWGLGSAIFALLSAVAVAGYRAGAGTWPWK